MSELTVCNRCTWLRIKRRYTHARLKPHPVDGFPSGVDAIDHGKVIAWFAEVPEVCACG